MTNYMLTHASFCLLSVSKYWPNSARINVLQFVFSESTLRCFVIKSANFPITITNCKLRIITCNSQSSQQLEHKTTLRKNLRSLYCEALTKESTATPSRCAKTGAG